MRLKVRAAVPAVWKEERTIESFEVDMFGQAKPQALFGLLLNSAWNCTRGTFYGYQELIDKNLMWVLLKLQLHIKRFPKWHDQIVLETWGKRVERLHALRDFAISSLSGERAVSATSDWTVLEKTTGRPLRFDPKSDGFPWLPEREELSTDLEKVPPLAGGSETARYHVRFSDIDVNGHVNATRYLQWMIDGQQTEVLSNMNPNKIEISFLSEALINDEVVVVSEAAGPNAELIAVRRPKDEKELCRGRIEWEKSS
jgi:medium-chain acyl-[acyl-carrier-protein] hydrolase